MMKTGYVNFDQTDVPPLASTNASLPCSTEYIFYYNCLFVRLAAIAVLFRFGCRQVGLRGTDSSYASNLFPLLHCIPFIGYPLRAASLSPVNFSLITIVQYNEHILLAGSSSSICSFHCNPFPTKMINAISISLTAFNFAFCLFHFSFSYFISL